MSAARWPAPLVQYALNLDSGGQARLRRGAGPEVLLLPGLATLLRDLHGSELDDAMLLLRVAALLGRDVPTHPAAALAEADLDPKRMGRLLTSGPEVLPDRLVNMARFLSAKSKPAAAAPFYWLMVELRTGTRHSKRAEWARRFSEAVPSGKPDRIGKT